MRSVRALIVVPMLVVTASCGGGSGSSTADAEFCEYLRTLEDVDPQAAPDDALSAIDQIIDRAPDGEIKGALQDLRPIFETMATIDPNDEAAFSEMMSLMFDPKVIAAGEVLEKYGTEVCGFDDTSGDAPSDTGVDWTTDPDMDMSSSALENLESSDISDAVERVLADQSTQAYVASSGWSSFGSNFTIDVDITGEESIDGVPLCEAVVDLVTSVDPDAVFTISVTLDGTAIAASSGDECTSSTS